MDVEPLGWRAHAAGHRRARRRRFPADSPDDGGIDRCRPVEVSLMKVVLFCGGLGTRLREHSETIPKPLATIGPRPIIWYLMRYYAHFGHTEFLLCLGHKGDMIREFLLGDPERPSNWKLHFIDTGRDATIAERLRAVEPYLRAEELFLANYSD